MKISDNRLFPRKSPGSQVNWFVLTVEPTRTRTHEYTENIELLKSGKNIVGPAKHCWPLLSHCLLQQVAAAAFERELFKIYCETLRRRAQRHIAD